MPDVKYPKNPNSDTAFVEEDGKKARAIKVAVVDGTIDYPKNANSDSCYVTVDGQKQRALMVADVSGEGTVEYPNNPNSTKGYVEIDGKKQRVVLTASLAGGGSTPTGTITITENGEHDVTDYATADVQVPTTGPDAYIPLEVNNGVLSKPTSDYVWKVPDDVTELGAHALVSAFDNSSSATTYLTTIDFNNVETIESYACYEMAGRCASLTSMLFTKVKTIKDSAFSKAFDYCSGLTELSFPALETIQGNSFGGSNSFYAFRHCNNLVAFHFPAAMQATVEAMSGYSDKWGATNATIYFDL